VKPELVARAKDNKVLCASIDCGAVIGYRIRSPNGKHLLFLDQGWYWHELDQVWASSKRIGRSPRRPRPDYSAIDPPGTRYASLVALLPTRVVCPICRRLLLLDERLGLIESKDALSQVGAHGHEVVWLGTYPWPPR
jgi:hypothetical protein